MLDNCPLSFLYLYMIFCDNKLLFNSEKIYFNVKQFEQL